MRPWRFRWSVVSGLVSIIVAFVIVGESFPPNLHRYQEQSTVILDADDRFLRAFATPGGYWRLPADLEHISPTYLKMLVNYEDQRFHWHFGVDPIAVVRALWNMVVEGRIVSGASTLTMQTARLLEPRSRTIFSKVIEMFRAVQLELRYSKGEILSMYLTLAPFGGNIEGIRAASLAYFGKEPSRLSEAEAALLVALPQAPSRYRPDRYPKAAIKARNRVVKRLASNRILSKAKAVELKEAPVPTERRPMPFFAPHLGERLAGRYPTQSRVETYIALNLQKSVERLAGSSLWGLSRAANVAIVVVENRGSVVRAYVGSADYWADNRAGRLDLARRIRSPGSTLKPLIYALAFEESLLHPETMIDDAPMRFGDYTPSNFDTKFLGRVTVRKALVRSLNVPAVAVLAKVGPSRLVERLRGVGVSVHLPGDANRASLPIALGGVGMSLLDLVTLYTGLTNGGLVTPLGITKDGPVREARRLVSPVAAWYVNDILAGARPPDGFIESVWSRTRSPIAYKTGTSYGFRDSWAVGFDARYTVGVWAGRPDGSPSPGRYGRNTAAPILFRVFDQLPDRRDHVVAPPPQGAVIVPTYALPTRLRYFRQAKDPASLNTFAVSQEATLQISFPVNRSIIRLEREGEGYRRLPLIAKGGIPPFYWLVNGHPLEGAAKQTRVDWLPKAPGEIGLTVMDRSGQIDRVTVWLER